MTNRWAVFDCTSLIGTLMFAAAWLGMNVRSPHDRRRPVFHNRLLSLIVLLAAGTAWSAIVALTFLENS
jgi:hypothetical protein